MSAQSSKNEDRIRDEAYRLWIEAGSPEGRDQEFWFEAQKALGGTDGDDASQTLGTGQQMDDNIDDLGRKPGGDTLDQPGVPKKRVTSR